MAPCPASGKMLSSALGSLRASSTELIVGTMMSLSPLTTRTGCLMPLREPAAAKGQIISFSVQKPSDGPANFSALDSKGKFAISVLRGFDDYRHRSVDFSLARVAWHRPYHLKKTVIKPRHERASAVAASVSGAGS